MIFLKCVKVPNTVLTTGKYNNHICGKEREHCPEIK